MSEDISEKIAARFVEEIERRGQCLVKKSDLLALEADSERFRKERDAALAELADSDQALRESRANDAAATRMLAEVREELAALKGGREAVAFVCEASSTHHGCPEGYGDILSEWLPAGTEVYTAPPAQASAWVADASALADRFISWPLPASVRPDGCAMNPEYPYRYGTNLLTWAQAKAMFEYVLAAPTPGASDGKVGGE